MGAWIEMIIVCDLTAKAIVAPYMGAWIEITITQFITTVRVSLPTWGRGLKFRNLDIQCGPSAVAPYMGAWIEIRNR